MSNAWAVTSGPASLDDTIFMKVLTTEGFELAVAASREVLA